MNVGRWLRHIREQKLVGKWKRLIKVGDRSIELSSKGAVKRLPLESNQVKWMHQVYRNSNIPCRESLEGDITKDLGNDQYKMTLFPIGMPLDELLGRGKVPDPVPVLKAILSFFVGLHAIGFVYIDLRPSNVIRANEGYLVIDLEFVRPVKETVPANLKCRSVLEEAGFAKMDMTASTCMDLVMLHAFMVTCRWTDKQDPHYGSLLAYLSEVGPATEHTASAALDILNTASKQVSQPAKKTRTKMSR